MLCRHLLGISRGNCHKASQCPMSQHVQINEKWVMTCRHLLDIPRSNLLKGVTMHFAILCPSQGVQATPCRYLLDIPNGNPPLAGVACLASVPPTGNYDIVIRVTKKSLIDAFKITW